MNRSPAGYTLIEAVIVVAVSSVIFIGVTTIFAGSREDVDFNQAKADIDTKFKGYANQVSTGTFAGSTTHRCSISSGADKRPVLTAAAGVTPGTSDKCVYVGKAIATHTGADKLYIYDVLGLRNKTDSSEPARSYADAKLEPAGQINSATGDFEFLFIEEYRLPSDLTVVSAQTGGTTANMLKIYSNLDSTNSSSRGIKMMTNDFTATVTDVTTDKSRLRGCIQQSGICTAPIALESAVWDLCVQNSGNSKRAKFSIKPTAIGVVTKVTDGGC